MGILLPALSRARRAARKIKCASQMRQIGLAFELYAADWDDWIITAKDPRLAVDGQSAWNFELLSYIGEKRDEDFDKAELWFCPEDKDPFPIGYGVYPHGVPFTSYALNGYYASARPPKGMFPGSPEAKLGPAGHFKTFQVRTASACMLMVETSHSGQIYDAEHPRVAQYDLHVSDRSHHRNTSGFYHNKSMNIVFVDGHVGSIKGRRCERVSIPQSISQSGGMFWPDLTLPSATEKPQLWGPGYRK
jgi:prepilin-type processing-associated H-X9-DG protein